MDDDRELANDGDVDPQDRREEAFATDDTRYERELDEEERRRREAAERLKQEPLTPDDDSSSVVLGATRAEIRTANEAPSSEDARRAGILKRVATGRPGAGDFARSTVVHRSRPRPVIRTRMLTLRTFPRHRTVSTPLAAPLRRMTFSEIGIVNVDTGLCVRRPVSSREVTSHQ